MLVHRGRGKRILRAVLHRYVPPRLVERPKQGFAVPVGDWLRTGLRDWAEDLLAESRLRQEGILDPAPVRTVWEEHLSGRANHAARLWAVLMFEAWLAEWA
jgi:asparagine synthase (glutamine-hydrolysing)